jgi:Asp-tRNA(Asn)/Glu-tRNA(Gln) amidotransferase A subunit family amidase
MMMTNGFGFDKIETVDTSKPFPLKGAKFALCKNTPNVWKEVGQGTADAMVLAKKLLQEAGATVEDLELPAEFSKAKDWYVTIVTADGHASFLGDYQYARFTVNCLPSLKE